VPEYPIKYANGDLTLRLPEGLKELAALPREMPALHDPISVLRAGLEQPTGRPPLKAMARGHESCVIVAPDHSLPSAYPLWLPELLNQFNQAGISDKNITVYIAGGTNAPMTEAQKLEQFGAEAGRRVHFVQHDCDSARLGKVGRTDWGTILTVEDLVFRCDMLVLTGAINYHPTAGFTGGRTGILPGCCGREAIRTNAKRAFHGGEWHKASGPGLLVNNPVSEDAHEACTLVKPNLTVDIVLNAAGEPAWLGVGDYGYVHKIGAKFLDDAARHKLPLRSSLAFIGAGGRPWDDTLLNAWPSLRYASGALLPGATVVWAADCAGGEGDSELESWRDLSWDECKSKLPTCSFSHSAIGGYFLRQFGQTHKVLMVTSLPEELVSAWGFTKAENMDQALVKAVGHHRPEQLTWLVAPNMGNSLLEVAD
jgi:nickel-dependent lactate racemase